MRSVIAPLGAVVENDLAELDARSAEVARRFIRRLRLEPELGAPATRGTLGVLGARRVYFDASSRPDDLFAAPTATRCGART